VPHSRAGRRQEYRPEFYRNLHHARDVLPSLRAERADFLEVAFLGVELDESPEYRIYIAN